MFDADKPGRFFRLPQVLDETGLSTARLYKLMASGAFPKPVTLGANSRAWLESEICAWKQDRIAARDSGTDADLRAVNPHIGRGRLRKRQAAA